MDKNKPKAKRVDNNTIIGLGRVRVWEKTHLYLLKYLLIFKVFISNTDFAKGMMTNIEDYCVDTKS